MMTPAWFNDTVIYHILIDRFAGFSSSKHWAEPRFLGGTLQGIQDRLPYLSELGINVLWISPFYETSAYHGYHITDFFRVDPHFGSRENLIALIHTAHRYNMKIIADFVPNHCSNHHPFFLEALQDKTSTYHNWFYFTKWPKEYLCFLHVRDLPKLNLTNDETQHYIISAAKYWLKLGLDGYRLDHVIGPSHDFWVSFRKEIKAAFPNIVLIGEAWMKGISFHDLRTLHVRKKLCKWLMGSSSDHLLQEYVGELDGVLDFRFQEIVRDFLIAPKRYSGDKEIQIKLRNHYRKFPSSYFLPTFLDNHDMNRVLFECRGDKQKLQQAASLQFSLPQPAIIYYGTEIGLTQQKSIWDTAKHGDIQARQPMKWKNQDTELHAFYKEIIARKRKKRESEYQP